MENLLQDEPWMLVPLAAILCGVMCALTGMITCTIKGVVQSREFEKSRREIAAYISEGSISPEDGERLLNVKPKSSIV